MTLLFHASDLHFGAEDRAALDWFAACVAGERPDAVIITGDLTMRARSSEFAAAQRWLTGLGAPVVVEPGNHDLPYFNPVRRMLRPYARVVRLQEQVQHGLALPGVHLVSLRTTARAQWRLNWSKGTVSHRALDRAMTGLRQAESDAMCIVMAHHPLIEADTQTSGRTTRGRAALDALVATGAQIVLSGHVHDPFDVQLATASGPVRLIGAGTLSERVRATRPSFNRLRIAADDLTVDVPTMG